MPPYRNQNAEILRELNATILGEGVPLITLHGGLGFDHTSFRPWLDPLAQHASLVYFDQRGNGHATVPDDWSQITHATYADDIERLRVALDAEQILLFGHSYGGFLALEYAWRHPDRVLGLILCNTGATYRHLDRIIENVRRVASPTSFAAIMDWLAAPSPDDRSLALGIAPLLPLYLHAPTDALVTALFGRIAFRASAFNYALAALAPDYDVTAHLPSLEMPTLVIAGENDPIFPWDCGPEILAAQMPNAEIARFNACGHYPFAEQPERFMESVRDWIVQRTGRRAGDV